MKTYEVLLTKVKSAKVQIEAENSQEAEDIAFQRFMDCEIELIDSGIPGDVIISVSEIGSKIPSSPGIISIYGGDLTTAKQSEILAAFGENCNYDVFPIVEIPITGETEESK